MNRFTDESKKRLRDKLRKKDHLPLVRSFETLRRFNCRNPLLIEIIYLKRWKCVKRRLWS
ncbi:MAG: hypothetical protein QW578_02890 [Thermoplasmatales archaeon]